MIAITKIDNQDFVAPILICDKRYIYINWSLVYGFYVHHGSHAIDEIIKTVNLLKQATKINDSLIREEYPYMAPFLIMSAEDWVASYVEVCGLLKPAPLFGLCPHDGHLMVTFFNNVLDWITAQLPSPSFDLEEFIENMQSFCWGGDRKTTMEKLGLKWKSFYK